MYLSPTPPHPFPSSFLDLLFPSLCSFLLSHFLALASWPEPSTVSPTISPSSVLFLPSSHEFIMRSKIEQWLFVPVPACHWSRMNNSATVVEVRIREKKEIILEPYHSGYFRTSSCRLRSCSAHPFFFLSSCSLSYLPPVHSLSHEESTDSSLSCPSFRRTAYKACRGWDWWWMKSASFVRFVPLHLHGCGVCILSLHGCICNMFVATVCVYIFQSQRVFFASK